jgi:hypothetical protein
MFKVWLLPEIVAAGMEVNDVTCPFAIKANKQATIKIIFVSNFPLIRVHACTQIYGGLTDKKN